MTTTMRNLIRTFSVAALLAAAAMSVPAGAVHAEQNTCGEIYGVSETKGGHVVPGSRVDKYLGNGRWKTYICDDDGNWIIFIDEKLDPGAQPPHPLGTRVHVAPLSGGGVLSPR
jgi:uncharacterized membrane protein